MTAEKFVDLIVYLSFFAILGCGIEFWLKGLFRRRREEVERRFRRQKIVLQHNFAHFYGRESIGNFQARGNGVLVLTEHELFFLKALPKREFSIPLSSITSVTNPRSHLGKSNVARLLRVDFQIDGQKDAIAWMVGNDVEAWTQEIKAGLRSKG